ncbi:MAG: long-chain-fatty-acid--CoA ligase [Deltaproteobacteria bacterium]|nr:long-chain-fatty-acid--CoA ligase [Deltaproteobacteria bacterium]
MEMTLGYSVVRNARKYPNKTAILCEEDRRTYRQLNERSNRLARALMSLGLGQGDRIATLSLNSVALMEAYIAHLKIGAITVPLNAWGTDEEIRHQADFTGCAFFVFHQDFLARVERIRPLLAQVKEWIFIGRSLPSFARSYEELIAPNSPEDFPIEVQEEDEAFILFTGGTTGVPKGAVLTHRSLLWNIISVTTENQSPTPEDTIYYPMPLFHTAALSRFLAYMYAGGTFIVSREFDAQKCLEIIQRERVTAMTGNPTIWGKLLQEMEKKKYDTSSMRMYLSSQGFLHRTMQQAIETRLFPNAQTFVSYALTEASPGVTLLKPEDQPREPGSVGKPYMCTEVRIVDEEDRDLPPGEVGEIIIKGPTVMKEYYKNPEETAQTLRGGWLHTGDLGKYDQDGFLYFVDRKKDMIKSGGLNIYSQEVEEVLARHPKIAEAVVIGVPDEKWGETVKAVVVVKQGEPLTEQEVIGHCKEYLASYKKPTSVAFVEALPKTPFGGKVLKRELRERFSKKT